MEKKYFYTFSRRWVQIIFFLFFTYTIWTTRYPLQNFFNPKIFFELDPLVMVITSVAQRVLLPGLLATFLMLVLTFVLGRFFCGWLCPMGSILDFWQYTVFLIKKIFYKKVWLKKSLFQTTKFRFVKYFILTLIIIFSIFGLQLAWIFDPITIFVRTVSFNIHPFITMIVDKIYIFFMTKFLNLYFLQTIYYWLKENFLVVNIPTFPHTKIVFYIFCFIIFLSLIRQRFWCRYLCPLGAMFAFVSKFSLLKRVVYNCKESCTYCKTLCRMGAIKDDNSYLKDECILCMDCVTYCPSNGTKFVFFDTDVNQKKLVNSKSFLQKISRKDFLLLLVSFTAGLVGFRNRFKTKSFNNKRVVIRPPGAIEEKNFVQQCIRCGNCMKVCPTNVLQPCLIESGWEGFWTPRLENKIGYCEYECTLCGKVCPTQAIKKLSVEKKVVTKIGTAEIDRTLCIPWVYNKNCLVCEEHCPIPTKAIKVVQQRIVNNKIINLPEVLPEMCIGCGICENKCPAYPQKAIKVFPV
jgi:polyferredoxin